MKEFATDKDAFIAFDNHEIKAGEKFTVSDRIGKIYIIEITDLSNDSRMCCMKVHTDEQDKIKS